MLKPAWFRPSGVVFPENAPPPPAPVRQVLFTVSDAALPSQVVGLQDAFNIEVLSGAPEHQMLWTTPREQSGWNPLHLPGSTLTVISEARYVPGMQTKIQFARPQESLFGSSWVSPQSSLVELYPFLPPVALLTEQEMAGRSGRLQEVQIQIIWNSRPAFGAAVETVYRAPLSQLSSLTRITQFGTQELLTMDIGPVPELEGTQKVPKSQSTALGFSCYWVRLVLPRVPQSIGTHWTFSTQDQPQWQVTPRLAAEMPPRVNHPSQLGDLLAVQDRLQLNRQRDISERAFWWSYSELTTGPAGANVAGTDPVSEANNTKTDPVYLIPQLFPSLAQPLDPHEESLKASWFHQQIRKFLTKYFLLTYTSGPHHETPGSPPRPTPGHPESR